VRTQELRPLVTDGLNVVPGDNEKSDLDQRRSIKPMDSKCGGDVLEHLLGLFGERRRDRPVRANADLTREEDKVSPGRNHGSVAVAGG